MQVRRFEPSDAEELTDLLHRAFRELGAVGLNFTAVDQSATTTVRRTVGGGVLGGRVAGGRAGGLAGQAQNRYCASHSRYFWGFRLHLLATPSGLIVGFALTGAKADEREALLFILNDPNLPARTRRQVLIADKNYFGAQFEATLADGGIELLRPAARAKHPGQDRRSSTRCARSSSRSTRPSRLSSTSNTTAGTP